MIVTGWDIGGVNTKAARVENGQVCAAAVRPYELQRAPARLADILRELAAEVGAGGAGGCCAITMTAELSQMFRTKREGVAFVLDAVEAAFPSAAVRVFSVDGRFVRPGDARESPLRVAAANWAATAGLVARRHPQALLVDVGTTTTDIIPIVSGRVAAAGRTDPERLASGELVYTGVVRTPAEAIASAVPFGDRLAGVSAEGFALAGDVHVWRGDLEPADYTWQTPDGRPPTREFAAERLARVICADMDMLEERAVGAIADALADAQRRRIRDAIRRAVAPHPSIRSAVVTGLGAFLGVRAAQDAGLEVRPLGEELGAASEQCAPAASVALLAWRTLDGDEPNNRTESPVRHGTSERARPVPALALVVKLGGGLLAHPSSFEAAVEAVARLARQRPLLVVPGGGPFAGAVRDVGTRTGLTDSTAHWMAILGMDQYGCLLASRIAGGVLVEGERQARRVAAEGRIPVLAPSRWLKEADPLPHSWDVTSDSIAAWVAGQVGAPELVLIKPPGAQGDDVVDRFFSKALPAGIAVTIVPADRLGAS